MSIPADLELSWVLPGGLNRGQSIAVEIHAVEGNTTDRCYKLTWLYPEASMDDDTPALKAPPCLLLYALLHTLAYANLPQTLASSDHQHKYWSGIIQSEQRLGEWLGDWQIGVRFKADATDYHPHRRVQTGALARPFFPQGQNGVKLTTYMHTTSKVRISGATPPFPEMSSRHRDNSISESKMLSYPCIHHEGVCRGGSKVPHS